MQSRQMSLVESVTNVAVGFAVALGTQLVVFPWFDLEASVGEHIALGSVFTCASIARSYLLRRLFNGFGR
jgi:hypothetical protein